MSTNFDQKEFAAALKMCLEVVDLKCSMPILHDVLVTQDQMQVTDLHLYLTVSCLGDGQVEALLPLKPLSVLTAPEGRGIGKVTLDNLGNVKAPGLDATLETNDPKDFPSWPADPNADNFKGSFGGSSADFADTLKWVAKAASHGERHPNLTHVEIRDHEIVAVDGHRVHMACIPSLGIGDDVLHIPAHVIPTLVKLFTFGDKDFTWEVMTGPWSRVSSHPWTLYFRNGDINFPPVDKVIPRAESANVVVKIDAALLGKSLKRLTALDKDADEVLLDPEGEVLKLSLTKSKAVLRVGAEIEGQTAATPAINIKGTTYPARPTGSPVAVDRKYLEDALPSKGVVELRLWAPYQQITVKQLDRFAVVMSMGY